MKKYLHCLLFILLLNSCQRDFLDRNPYGNLDENTFYTQKEHANLAAIACYNSLTKLNNHWASAQLELGMTDDFSNGGFKDAQSFYSATYNPSEPNIIEGIWKKAYQGIAVCNLSIENVNKMPADIIDEPTKNIYLAEMRFVRAFWYYRLIQFYGDVPLRLTSVNDPTKSSEVEIEASSKQKILDELIIPDFEFAAKYLPAKWESKDTRRATKGAAFAYLTDVYVYIKQWDRAIDAGKNVETSGYRLMENPADALREDNEDSAEIIFAIAYGQGLETDRDYYFGTKEDLGGNQGRIMRGDSYSGDYFYPSNDFIDSFETIDGNKIENSKLYDSAKKWLNRDPRFDTTFFTETDVITTTTGVVLNWNSKWLVNTVTGFDIQKRGKWYGSGNNRRTDNIVMRLPRVYLLVAEAYANKSDFANSELYIEKVRSRARNYALKNKSKYVPSGLNDSQVLPKKQISNLKDAMDAIDYESRVEFFTEDAIRYFDLKRWNKLQTKWPKNGDFVWNDKLYNLPYPASELSSNKKLKQNHTGWGS